MPKLALVSIILVPLLPLLGFVVLGLFGRRYLKNFSGVLGTGLLFLSAVISLLVAYDYFFVLATPGGIHFPYKVLNLTWLSFAPGFSVDLNLYLDPISVMMTVVVSFIS